MGFEELVILLPCHGLEDFPAYAEGDEASGLLAGWTALWHPALIHSADKMPTWSRMDDPPEVLENRLIVAPPVVSHHGELPTGFIQRARESGACAVRRKLHRDEILQAALQQVDNLAAFSADVVADFHALGYAYLQTQILTRQVNYYCNLDEQHFGNQVVAAAHAAAAGDGEETERRLTACFDLLAEERDMSYSVDLFLLDLVLLTPQTLGQRLDAELDRARQGPLNFLLSDGVLPALGQQPDKLQRLKTAWHAGEVGLLACDQGEGPLPLLPIEAVAQRLAAGRAAVEAALGRPPTVFGRRQFGLTPNLPGPLSRLGYVAALHATLEDGRFPEGRQAKGRWQGADGAQLDCLARAPLNAAADDTFLGLAHKISEAMNNDQVAALTVAHWPGTASAYWDDLRRVARRSPVLGKLVTVEQFFADTEPATLEDQFRASQYRSPYLRQAVIRREQDPLSRWTRYAAARTQLAAAAALNWIAAAIDRRPRDDGNAALQALDAAVPGVERDAAAQPDAAAQLQAAAEAATAALPQADANAAANVLVWNPHCFTRRVHLSLPSFAAPPAVERPVYAACDGPVEAIVDVPPMGYAWLQPGAAQRRRRGEPAVADTLLLRNEFMEVKVNQQTGGVASMQCYETRGNRMSQQIALRRNDEQGKPQYSQMIAERIETLQASPLSGAIRSRGRLQMAEDTVGRFVQTMRLTRGSRVLDLHLELSDLEELKSDPWNHYYCSRIAWKEESADLSYDVNQTRHAAGENRRLEATRYVNIDAGGQQTTLFTDGLPWHRRVGLASLDSLLVVRGERRREFSFGAGLDVAYPLQEAEARLAPPVALQNVKAAASPDNAWLFHLECRNVIGTHWSAIHEQGRVVGFELRLLETSNRPARVKLKSLRPLASARVVDGQQQPLAECRVEDGAAHLELAPREWLSVQAWWSR